jgi:hypothetical protein
MIIKEDYVSYEVAKLLKEKGFNIECRAAYTDYGKLFTTQIQQYITNVLCSKGYLWDCTAPTLQMAMKWLREEKNIFIVIEPHSYDYLNEKTSSYVFAIWEGDNYMEVYSYKNSELRGISYLTYEEAVEAALKYILEKLI